jgi:starch synthase
LKVLFLASEIAPYSKTGGLGDVAGALPAALAARGHQVRVVTPRYGTVSSSGLGPAQTPLTLDFPFGSVTARFRTLVPRKNLELVFLEQEQFFGSRPRVYGEPDDAQRFGFFAMAALAHAQFTGFAPEVVHLNDWQTGLAALALKRSFADLGARSVVTIHNLAYQGNFPSAVVPQLGIPWELFNPQGVEFYGNFGFLKTALVYSDAITTVSPSYAREIQTHEGGHGLDGLLRHRTSHVTGILNGIDDVAWNPATDTALQAPFSRDDISGKEACTRALLEEFGLPKAPRGPVFGSVGRMAEQKGVELWQQVVQAQLVRGAFAVVLGSGEAHHEDAWRALAARFPKRLAVRIGFDEAVAHRIEAGSDFFVMPSKFEPCGLNQMYSLRYGAIPIVRAVGGLKDTVVDLTQPNPTGISFDEFSPAGLFEACERAWGLWQDAPKLFAVRRRGMAQDFSWDHSAAQYEAVYATGKNA